ncbi:MAG: hypothetical protein RMK29_22360 [Myxococcales bacterium]|nr:hypothetical protein [Myxococcales bacterium]
MTTPPDDLGPRIARLIAEQTGEQVQVHAVAPLPGGACQDLFRVDLVIGAAARRLVLRSDARSGLSGTLSRRQEFAVIGAAVAAGVRTPPARWLVRDLVRPSALPPGLGRGGGAGRQGGAQPRAGRHPTAALQRAGAGAGLHQD